VPGNGIVPAKPGKRLSEKGTVSVARGTAATAHEESARVYF
jgi:hypothetical protein